MRRICNLSKFTMSYQKQALNIAYLLEKISAFKIYLTLDEQFNLYIFLNYNFV